VGETLKETGEGERIWDAVECFIAFGVHVVDFYGRNHLPPSLKDYLVLKLVGKIPATIKDSMVELSRGGAQRLRPKDLQERPLKALKTVKGVLDKLEQASVMHLGGPQRRDDAQFSSLGAIGMFLMCAFLTDSDVPTEKLSTWEQMDPRQLRLYDIAREVAWDFHENIRIELDQRLAEAGF
jgi:hypothetical protein